MEINHVQEFLVLAETRNYLEAADILYISQSTLSRHIQALEAEMGTELFTRTTRRVELNEYGRLFLPYARQLVQIRNDYNTVISNRMRIMKDKIIIGSVPVMLQYGITDLLADFRVKNSSIYLEVLEEEPSRLKNQIRKDSCDFAFVWNSGFDKEGEFVTIPYKEDNLVAVVPKNHPLAGKKSINLIELKNEAFMMMPENTFMHSVCQMACRDAGFVPRIGFSGNMESNIIAMVGKGMGCALVMRQVAEFNLNPNIAILDIVPGQTSAIQVIYKKDVKHSSAVSCFLKFMYEYTKKK